MEHATAIVPAAVGYFRLSAGPHVLTDIAIVYVLGTTTGILVPELHKKKNGSLKINADTGTN